MPDQPGKLSPKEKDKIVGWLNEKSKQHHCPVCGENNWAIGDHLLHGQVYTPGSFTVGGSAYPMVFMVCNNCAYVRQFMSVPMGIGSNGG